MSDATLHGTRDVIPFFESAVSEAARARGYDPDAASARYLSGVLADYVRPEALMAVASPDRPLAVLLGEALDATGAERFQRLRRLGDHVLYVSGFFSDHLARSGVPPRLARSVGTEAYGAASSMLRRGGGTARGPDVFDELATNFDELVVVLGDVADALYATSARDSRGILDLYERWRRRGSNALADALVRSGVLPTRGQGTIH